MIRRLGKRVAVRLAAAWMMVLAATAFAQSPAPAAGAGDYAAVTAKLEAQTRGPRGCDDSTLSQQEFMVWIRGIEALPANAAFTWCHIITKIHHSKYPNDSDQRILGIRLFKNSKGLFNPAEGADDNAGFQRVDIGPGCVPKFVINAKGEKVDISHAYAGIRALVNRDPLAVVMGYVNTGWGDAVQVPVAAGAATAKFMFHSQFFAFRKMRQDVKEFLNSPNYWPDDQDRGNEIGNAALDFLLDRRYAKLSEAFEKAFEKVSKE